MHANWEAMFAGIPNFRSEVMRTVDDGNTTWVEWKWTGTRTDGQPFQVRGVALFEVEDGLIPAGCIWKTSNASGSILNRRSSRCPDVDPRTAAG